MSLPEQVTREFSWDQRENDASMTRTLTIRPGRVLVEGVGLLSWHDTERFATELQRAARDARFMVDLYDRAVVDIRLVCTQCEKPFREGVVTTKDAEREGRRRHVEGSPECERSRA